MQLGTQNQGIKDWQWKEPHFIGSFINKVTSLNYRLPLCLLQRSWNWIG